MKTKPKILITNDDGIDAKGIWHLWNALCDFADLTIVAPDGQQSGKGVSLSLRVPLISTQVSWEKNTKAWRVKGTPADCMKVALSSLLDEKPDMIVSGINEGCNSGRNVLYSGTIGALIEGVYRNIPGIAFSCRDYHSPQYAAYSSYIPKIVAHFLKYPIPQGTLINVNFPKETGSAIKGVRYTRMGEGYWVEDPLPSEGDFHHFGVKWHEQEEHPESDVFHLKAGYITATPIHVGNLTDYDHLSVHKELFESSLKSD